MDEIDYNMSKIEYLTMLSKKAVEQSDHVKILIERIECLKQINEQNVQVEARINNVKQQNKKEIDQVLAEETKLLDEVTHIDYAKMTKMLQDL